MNHVLNNKKFSCFTQKHSVAKLLPTRQVMNVLPRLKFLSVITAFTPLTVFLIKSFTTNKIYLHGARSVSEPESPVHIGLEIKMPITRVGGYAVYNTIYLYICIMHLFVVFLTLNHQCVEMDNIKFII
jgi:hypothetical protein